jgi:hypothetical protein
MGLASRLGMAWRMASLGMGRSWRALLVDAVGYPPLCVGLSRRPRLSMYALRQADFSSATDRRPHS